MTNLSINLNKIALLRNSRGGDYPWLLDYAHQALDLGAHGLTLHPRADARHARLDDVLDLAALPQIASGERELNVEGDLRPELINLVSNTAVAQFTIVPVVAGEITSSRGWRAYDNHQLLQSSIARLRTIAPQLRISVFCDPNTESVRLAQACGIDAVEFYTGHYANDSARRSQHLQDLQRAVDHARRFDLRVHLGHDLDLDNLPEILAKLQPEEVSIGHALCCDALQMGFAEAVRRYLVAVQLRQ